MTRGSYLFVMKEAKEHTMSQDPIVEVLQQYGSYVMLSILLMLYWLFMLRLTKLLHEYLMMHADSHHASAVM